MLRQLTAHGYAIIDEIDIELSPGLNILTGETGAGKSIILGTLGFVLGDRVSDDIIGRRNDSCRVEARFDLSGLGALGKRLVAAGILRDGSAGPGRAISHITVARELSRGGRSRCRLNGEQVPIKTLKAVGDMLVDFHGQHEHQLLLRAERHVDFLDAFAGLEGDREALSTARRDLIALGERIRDLEDDIRQAESRRDLTRFEIDELAGLNLVEGEDERLESRLRVLEHAEKIIELGGEAIEIAYDGDESAMQLLARARGALEKLASLNPDLEPLLDNLDAAEVAIKEVAEELRSHVSRIDLEGSDPEAMRDRLAQIERVKRKYGETVPELLRRLERLRNSLDNREETEALLVDLREEKSGKSAALADLALKLSGQRKKASRKFEKLVQEEIRGLGIEGGAFKVVFEETEDGEEVGGPEGGTMRVGEYGIDQVEFFVRTNPGENLLPLRRIASGGEVSRVMLALKSILAEVDEVGTLIFDEIDAGIGGGTADTVAVKLRQVADSRQVICITHLPQIAVAGNLHLKVEKVTGSDGTSASVTPVEGRRRIEEVARMIDGRRPSGSAIAHAEEILSKAGSADAAGRRRREA
jgi:DNA repair protein RecN (Recombination protein N)